jgi:methyltransferase family protein
MRYLTFLRGIHDALQPSTYLEIGIRNGGSLALSRCRSVGIDPAYNVTAEIDGDLALFRTISDEYFSRPEPLAPFGGRPIELAFIDGLHLFEFALRDFINVERHAAAGGVAIFDDVFPRTVDEAARDRHTLSWTGDVFKVLQVLERYRPDLVCVRVGTQPTGLFVVAGLDPSSTVLSDQYDEIVAQFVTGDPQDVPDEILSRLGVQPPHRLLASPFFRVIREARDGGRSSEQLRAEIGEVLQSHLGLGPTGAARAEPA